VSAAYADIGPLRSPQHGAKFAVLHTEGTADDLLGHLASHSLLVGLVSRRGTFNTGVAIVPGRGRGTI